MLTEHSLWMQSRLEGRPLSASEFDDARADEVNGRSVDSDDMSDGGSTVDMENGSGHTDPGSAAPWWGVVMERFPPEKVSLSNKFSVFACGPWYPRLCNILAPS